MKKFRTTFTALITPFYKGQIDFESLESLIQHQLKNGIGGFVVNGTTAESPTLEWTEVEKIFRFTQTLVPKDFPLIMGTGSNSTKKTIQDTLLAKQLGADAALVVVPYYNKPPQRGLVEHFKAIATGSEFPIILYNVPGRTITALSLDSIRTLAKEPYIIGIKEASGQIDFAKEICSTCGSEFILLSGDDGTYIEFLKNGGHGVISVASHVIPSLFVQWLKDPNSASDFPKYKDLIEKLFIEANPIPVKKALQLMGIIRSAELRLPLMELSSDLKDKLKIEMQHIGILNQ